MSGDRTFGAEGIFWPEGAREVEAAKGIEGAV